MAWLKRPEYTRGRSTPASSGPNVQLSGGPYLGRVALAGLGEQYWVWYHLNKGGGSSSS